jgi:hypothetical protein
MTEMLVSRSRTGGKAPGYEYWSRRPFNRCGGSLGKKAKRRTHKAERRSAIDLRELHALAALPLREADQ